MVPEPPKYFGGFLRSSYQRGYVRGVAEGFANECGMGFTEGLAIALMMFLAERQLPVTDAQIQRIRGCTDTTTLEGWLDRVLSVASVDELLGPPSG